MKTILWLIAFLIFASLANAQVTPKQIDSIRNAVIQELNPKIDEFLKEVPRDFAVYNNRRKFGRPVFIISGYVKAGQYLDSKHRPLPDFITVLQVVEVKMDSVKAVEAKGKGK